MRRVDPWDALRRAAADKRSGSVEIALQAAAGVAQLQTRREILRAARALLRAHPAMATLWRLFSETLEAGDPERASAYADRLRAQTEAAADAIRWIATKRSMTVITHSSSASVYAALGRVRRRVARVVCAASLPGGEGRALARKLERDGFDTTVVPDAAVARACDEADLALVGADAVTDAGVVNKIGTTPLALAARHAGIGCYPIACNAKLIPRRLWQRVDAPLYEETPLDLFDAVVTERGPQRPGAIRRGVAQVRIPSDLMRLAR
jgi:translation initiation factor 2B subunit (eIF-2B alpha/beta/delta family)